MAFTVNENGRTQSNPDVTYLTELNAWKALLASGQVSYVRPRKWCGVWQLYAYNTALPVPYVGGIADSPEAYTAVREAGISIEDLQH